MCKCSPENTSKPYCGKGDCRPTDWSKLETEYVTSNLSVAEVLQRHGLSASSGNATRHTSLWGEKRAKYRQEIQAERLASVAAARKEALVTLDITVFGLADKLGPALTSYMAQKGGLSPSDVKIIAELILLRSSQSTSLLKAVKQEELTEVEVDELLNKFLETEAV